MDTTSIKGGEAFVARFEGTAVFPDWYVVLGLSFLPDVVTQGNLVDLRAPVRVRRGATRTGPVVVLVPDEDQYPFRCSDGRKRCNPENDLDGVPGLRGNTDCQSATAPPSANNPCGRFIPLPVSNDCDPGGVCDSLGKNEQCAFADLCAIDDFRIELQALDDAPGQYIADEEGHVLFGFDDTHVALREGGVNDGTQIIPTPVYENPGPFAVLATFLNLPVAFECAMGIDCRSGPGCSIQLSSPAPDEALISFPIMEAP